MTTLRQLLVQKGDRVWAIDPDDSVFNAVTEMASKDVGGLLVMEGNQVVGIITERDYARNVILRGKTSPETPVPGTSVPVHDWSRVLPHNEREKSQRVSAHRSRIQPTLAQSTLAFVTLRNTGK